MQKELFYLKYKEKEYRIYLDSDFEYFLFFLFNKNILMEERLEMFLNSKVFETEQMKDSIKKTICEISKYLSINLKNDFFDIYELIKNGDLEIIKYKDIIPFLDYEKLKVFLNTISATEEDLSFIYHKTLNFNQYTNYIYKPAKNELFLIYTSQLTSNIELIIIINKIYDQLINAFNNNISLNIYYFCTNTKLIKSIVLFNNIEEIENYISNKDSFYLFFPEKSKPEKINFLDNFLLNIFKSKINNSKIVKDYNFLNIEKIEQSIDFNLNLLKWIILTITSCIFLFSLYFFNKEYIFITGILMYAINYFIDYINTQNKVIFKDIKRKIEILNPNKYKTTNNMLFELKKEFDSDIPFIKDNFLTIIYRTNDFYFNRLFINNNTNYNELIQVEIAEIKKNNLF